MTLNRHTVERAAGEHIRLLQQFGRVEPERKLAIRRLHERAAEKVRRKARGCS